jgi:hypothetical protein
MPQWQPMPPAESGELVDALSLTLDYAAFRRTYRSGNRVQITGTTLQYRLRNQVTSPGLFA